VVGALEGIEDEARAAHAGGDFCYAGQTADAVGEVARLAFVVAMRRLADPIDA